MNLLRKSLLVLMLVSLLLPGLAMAGGYWYSWEGSWKGVKGPDGRYLPYEGELGPFSSESAREADIRKNENNCKREGEVFNVTSRWYDSSGSSSGGSYSSGGYSTADAYADALSPFFSALGRSLAQDLFGNPEQERAQQEALKRQREEEARQRERERQIALDKWNRQKEAAAREDERRKQEEIKKGQDLAASFRSGEDGGMKLASADTSSLSAFRWDDPGKAHEMKIGSMGYGKYDASSMKEMNRLECAAYFSGEAQKAMAAGDSERANYLNDQAAKVSSGQMYDEECIPCAAAKIQDPERPVPEYDDAADAYYFRAIEDVQKRIVDVDIRLDESRQKKQKAEEKVNKAREEVTRLQEQAAAVEDPAQKQEQDDLLAQAEQLLQEAEDGLQDATEEEEKAAGEREALQGELEQVEASIQTDGTGTETEQ